MRPFHSSDTLEELVTTCVFPPSDARDLPAALRSACECLSSERVAFALAGRTALARYCRAQFTDRLVLRLEDTPVGREQMASLPMEVVPLLRDGSSVRLEIGIATTPAESLLLSMASPTRWMNAQAPVAAAEHLLWLSCASWGPNDEWDAINVLQSGHVDWVAFREAVSKDARIIERAEDARRRAERETTSYSDMMERRMAEREASPPR